ncbi:MULTISPECIES: ester cyclase [unclassified Devosia]|uniref:ester cyclase n=1 Tax=unclassified Devosia TaxID=196773 RepID=UPI001555A11A
MQAANARDFSAIADLISPDVTINGRSYRRDDVVDSLKSIVQAVPDFTWEVEELFVDDDRIAARLRDTGTPGQTWLGLESTGCRVDFTEFASYRIRDSRFAEMWFLMDYQAIARQLGVLP